MFVYMDMCMKWRLYLAFVTANMIFNNHASSNYVLGNVLGNMHLLDIISRKAIYSMPTILIHSIYGSY